MRYTHKEGLRNRRTGGRKTTTLLADFLLAGGVYMLLNTLSPMLPPSADQAQATAKRLTAEQPKANENRIYIPQINVDIPVVLANGNEAAALEQGAVHRVPTNGDPSAGGNFVVAAHRFNIGLTPGATRAKSPFYHINLLNNGDQIYVDYEGKRYVYEIYEKDLVPPTAVEIEKRTDKPRLTMYSCELAGPAAGREVVYAKPVGTVAWSNGKPAVETL